MTLPHDRVLICVINRQRDFDRLRTEHWYRIPQTQMLTGVHADILAFFTSRAFGHLNGAVHFYAPITGIELSYRRWLLPDETAHARADERYYRVAVGPLQRKNPPLANTDQRTVAFIHTTWARFDSARALKDL